MAAYSTGASWSFPDDLPGGWVKVDSDETTTTEAERAGEEIKRARGPENPQEEARPSDEQSNPGDKTRRRTHYPPRQCRICLEVVLPTFHTPESTSSSLPASFQPTPRVTYSSPGEGGRLLRPCNCKGTQKYVHEFCLSAWRLQDPLQKRNYWQCPICGYKYKLQRLTWGGWISSTAAQVGLTLAIFVLAMFALGFVADPIINMYLDPVSTIANAGGPTGSLIFEDEPASWAEHFVKGLASLGLLGFAKFLLTLSPWHWFNMRGGTVYVGGGRSGTGATGRDRLNHLSWVAIVFGIATFLYAVWKGVRAWARRTLEAAGERVMDVPGGEEDDEGEEC